MNINDLYCNNSTKYNVGLLKDKFLNKTILLLDEEIKDIKVDHLKWYFDIIICQKEAILDYYSSPDIYISTRLTPYINNVLNIEHYTRLTNTLCCVTSSEITELNKRKMKIPAHILLWEPTDEAEASHLYTTSGLLIGLSDDQPALHLSKFAGATNIFSTNILSGCRTDIVEYMTEKTGYLPKNIKNTNRANIIKSIGL